jgi:hypothetical protein
MLRLYNIAGEPNRPKAPNQLRQLAELVGTRGVTLGVG